MANQAAFESGYDTAWQAGEQNRAHKQALSDEEFKQVNDELFKQRDAIQSKLPALKDDPTAYQSATDQLTTINKAIRLHWHPDKNPGMIQKYGHVLTDKLKLTKPLPTQQQRDASGNAKDTAETQRIEAAAPLSPDEISQQQAKAAVDQKEAISNWTIDWAKRHGVSDDALKELTNRIAGVPIPKLVPITGEKPTKGPDGLYRLRMRDTDSNTITELQMPADYTPPAVKPIRGGLIRVKPGQSPTGWVETRVDPYTSKVVGYVITTPSRYYQGTTTSRTTTDPAGVTSTSSATTTPTNTAETDLSKFPETDVSTFGNIPLMSDDGTPVPQRSSESTPNTPQGSSSVTPSGGEATTPQESTPKPTLKELKKEAEARKPQNVSTSEKLSDNPRGPQYLPVDENGYIPSTDNVNEQLREAANQLLDGVAMKDVTIPTRDKPAAESLARKYGWDQGAFLPREIIQLNNAEQFLDSALNSKKFMNALNEGVASSVKTSMATADPSKEGVFGRGVQALASKGLNPNEQEYRRLSNNMLGTIAGLSSILRSGRATEGLINRLKLELPNVMTSSNSKDAKQQILNIKKEIDLALRKSSVRRVDKDTQSGSSDTTNLTDSLRKKLLEHVNDEDKK